MTTTALLITAVATLIVLALWGWVENASDADFSVEITEDDLDEL